MLRNLTKSTASYTWAMSVFGMQQAITLLTPGSTTSAAAAFDAVTEATIDTFGDNLKRLYHAGDRIQSGLIDAVFDRLIPATDSYTPALPEPELSATRPSEAKLSNIKPSNITPISKPGFTGATSATGVPADPPRQTGPRADTPQAFRDSTYAGEGWGTRRTR